MLCLSDVNKTLTPFKILNKTRKNIKKGSK